MRNLPGIKSLMSLRCFYQLFEIEFYWLKWITSVNGHSTRVERQENALARCVTNPPKIHHELLLLLFECMEVAQIYAKVSLPLPYTPISLLEGTLSLIENQTCIQHGCHVVPIVTHSHTGLHESPGMKANTEFFTRTGQTVFTIFCFLKVFKMTKLVPKCLIMSVEHY